MAVAHSAASESHTGATGSSAQAAFSWTHTQTGTPQGVVVFVSTYASVADLITSVTYGGVALTRLTGGLAQDGAGELGRLDTFFLGSGLGTGSQTITVNRTNNATVMYAAAATVTAAANTAVPTSTIVLLEGDGTLAAQTVNDTSPGTNSVRYAGCYSGLQAPPTAGTGSTLLNSIDIGNYGSALVRETTAGQGARSIGFTGATDDRAAVHLVIRELVPRTETPIVGAFTLTGNDAAFTKVTPSKLDAEVGTFTLTGQPAGLAEAKAPLIADAGAFAVSGQPATLKVSHKITGETGQFSLVGSDPYYSSVSLLLHFDGANGSTSFIDDSINQFTPTVNGNAQISTAQSVFGGSSALFDGAGDFLSYATNSAFTYTGNFTFEFRVYVKVMQRSGIIANGATSFTGTAAVAVLNHPNNTNRIGLWNNPSLGSAICTTNALSINTWYHIAFVRSGTLVTCYQDGVAVDSGSASGTFSMSATELKVGSYWGGDFSGHLEELRLESVARYQSAFTVPTLPLLGQNPFLKIGWALDGGTGAFALTGNAADLRHNPGIEAGTGSFNLAGNDATLTEATPKAIAVDVGPFTLASNGATLRQNYALAAEVGAFTATGQPATLRHNPRIEGARGAFALNGGSPALLQGYYLSGGAGTFTETGQPATFRRTWAIQGGVGTFTLTGNPAGLTELGAYEIDPLVGAFTLTGRPATLAQSQIMPIMVGTFALNGQPAALRHSPAITGERGQFTLTGQPATLKQGYLLTGATGAFTFTGNPATLAKQSAKQLAAAVGTFSLTGQPAALSRSRLFPADRGQFTLTGQPATLRQNWRTTGDRAQFTLTGNPAALTVAYSLLGGRGAFTLTGNQAGLADTDRLDATAGAFILTGLSATLAKASTARRRNILIF